MRLHTVFITYNRLELTKRAIASYLETVSVPWTASIVDNASTDGTEEWFFDTFNDEPIGFTALEENKYPGYAANLGWTCGVHAIPEFNINPTHLHRADNDHIFLPGWCEEVQRVFKSDKIGQVGLRTNREECPEGRIAPINVGGNCVIRRELWDKGLRYDERPWPQLAFEVGRGYTEDSLLSPAVKAMGYTWTRVGKPCIQAISEENPDDEYYIRSWADRKMKPPR